MRRRQVVGAVCAAGVVAAAVVGGPRLLGANQASAADETVVEAPIYGQATATVRDLTEERSVNGTVAFGRPLSLPINAQGLVTAAPESGDLLNPGDELIRAGDKPVFLAEGTQPLYRELRRVRSGERDVAGDKTGHLKGADVEQLQQFLIDQGFDDKGRLEVDGTFGLTTERAVKDWQRGSGHPATGSVDGAQLVFVDGQVRIETAPSVGEQFSGVTVTSTSPTVTATVSSANRSFFEVGAVVVVESGSASTSATVTSAKRTVGQDGSSGYEIEVDLGGNELEGAESVKVVSTKVVAADVLTVPVGALVALAEGGWAVQVETGSGPQLTAVTLGQVVDGFAEIEGIDAGTEVVVPA